MDTGDDINWDEWLATGWEDSAGAAPSRSNSITPMHSAPNFLLDTDFLNSDNLLLDGNTTCSGTFDEFMVDASNSQLLPANVATLPERGRQCEELTPPDNHRNRALSPRVQELEATSISTDTSTPTTRKWVVPRSRGSKRKPMEVNANHQTHQTTNNSNGACASAQVPSKFCFSFALEGRPNKRTKQGTRVQRACLRCRVNKEKCSGDFPCDNCQRVLLNVANRRGTRTLRITSCFDADILQQLGSNETLVRGLGRIRPTCTEFLLQNDLGVSYEKIIVTPLMQLWTFSRIIPSDPFKRWVENFEPEHDYDLETVQGVYIDDDKVYGFLSIFTSKDRVHMSEKEYTGRHALPTIAGKFFKFIYGIREVIMTWRKDGLSPEERTECIFYLNILLLWVEWLDWGKQNIAEFLRSWCEYYAGKLSDGLDLSFEFESCMMILSPIWCGRKEGMVVIEFLPEWD